MVVATAKVEKTTGHKITRIGLVRTSKPTGGRAGCTNCMLRAQSQDGELAKRQ